MSEIVKNARARISNILGQKLASKATDEFCLAYGSPDASFATLEDLPSPSLSSVILEFTPQNKVSETIVNAVERVRGSEAWTSVREMLKRTEVLDPKPGVVTEVAESGRSEPQLLSLNTARLLRYLKVVSLRDNFFKISTPITQAIESNSLSTAFPGFETGQPLKGRPSITDVCWLNNTVRSWADPRALAEVVADDSIERIDLPRRLEPEINFSSATVGAPPFRRKFNRTGRDVIVAVIDGEVAVTHPALKGRVAHKKNYTAEPWGHPSAHGTAVAGIIASNDDGFSGMAPEATIYSYKVIASNRLLNGTDFDGALAIQQAVEDGAHIANCSWGNGPASDGTSREARACDRAWNVGLVIVKSAGNRGPGGRTLTTPADAQGVIVVGATDHNGTVVQDYSSRGPAGGIQRPHLVAPGGTFEFGIHSCLTGGGFGDCGAGTSFAAPHISGILALLIERDPSLTPDGLRNILLQGSLPLDGIDGNTQGAGAFSLVRVP